MRLPAKFGVFQETWTKNSGWRRALLDTVKPVLTINHITCEIFVLLRILTPTTTSTKTAQAIITTRTYSLVGAMLIHDTNSQASIPYNQECASFYPEGIINHSRIYNLIIVRASVNACTQYHCRPRFHMRFASVRVSTHFTVCYLQCT